jgi:hypothetical protein
MKISKGPMLIAYASLIDEPIDSLMDWVNACVNDGWPESPKTEKERLNHIKEFITNAIDSSITAHIKASLAEKKAA